jgi:hypothetical protein
VVILYISPRFGNLHQEKSGNPGVREEAKAATYFCLSFFAVRGLDLVAAMRRPRCSAGLPDDIFSNQKFEF